MNFRSLDPSCEGLGLTNTSKSDRKIWSEYSNSLEKLRSTADAIRSHISASSPALTPQIKEGDEEFIEGRILEAAHKRRERSSKVAPLKKHNVFAKEGELACSACGFDLFKIYGKRGPKFAECHHKIPISELSPGSKTKDSDLCIVCSNCHRMIHRKKPMLKIEELQEILDQQKDLIRSN